MYESYRISTVESIEIRVDKENPVVNAEHIVMVMVKCKMLLHFEVRHKRPYSKGSLFEYRQWKHGGALQKILKINWPFETEFSTALLLLLFQSCYDYTELWFISDVLLEDPVLQLIAQNNTTSLHKFMHKTYHGYRDTKKRFCCIYDACHKLHDVHGIMLLGSYKCSPLCDSAVAFATEQGAKLREAREKGFRRMNQLTSQWMKPTELIATLTVCKDEGIEHWHLSPDRVNRHERGRTYGKIPDKEIVEFQSICVTLNLSLEEVLQYVCLYYT